MKRTHHSIVSMMLVMCMLMTLSAFSGSIVVTAAAQPVKTTIGAADYTKTPAGTVPAGWIQVGALEVFLKQPNWGMIGVGENKSGVGMMLLDEYIWSEDLTISIDQFNMYTNSGMIYFSYTNASNYYGLVLSSNEVKLVKMDKGVSTTLATSTYALSNGSAYKLKINRTAAGVITADIATTGAFEPLFDAVTDTTHPSGKIGIGFIEYGGGHYGGFKFEGMATKVVPSPSPSPSPSPTPDEDGLMYQPVYQDNFSAPNDAWVNQTTTLMEISNGTLGGGDWNNNPPAAIYYTGKAFSGSYKVEMDITDIGNSPGNKAGIMFSAQTKTPESKIYYYAVVVSGKQAGQENAEIRLVRGYNTTFLLDANHSVDLTEPYNANELLDGGKVRITITSENGKISVDCTKGTTTTSIFKDVTDQSGYPAFTSGYIGAVKWASGAKFDNVLVQQKMEAATTIVSPQQSANARYLGRAVSARGATEMHFPLSGIEFVVTNTTEVLVEAQASEVQSGRRVLFGVIVDDGEYVQIECPNTQYQYISIAKFATPGTHKIKLIKLNALDGRLSVRNIKAKGAFGVENPTISASNAKAKHIEVYGDSITTGYGLQSGANAVAADDAWKSYAGLTAKYFDADINMAAIGGAGFKNAAGEPPLDGLNPQKFYKTANPWNAVPEYDFAFTTTPDIIVVNIGTNGGSKNLPSDYELFVNTLRTAHNDTNKQIPIILSQGPMDNYAYPNIQTAVANLKQAGDNNVYALSLGIGKVAGVDGHPTFVQQQEAAEILIEKIQSILPDWSGAAYAKINSAVLASGKVTVSFSVTNTQTAGKAIVAGYDANGVCVAILQKSIAAGNITDTMVLQNSSIQNVKLFVWEDLPNARPLTSISQKTVN